MIVLVMHWRLSFADCCFVMTDWKEFNAICSDQLAETMAEPVVIDCRQVLRLSKLDERISYRAVGIKKGR
jgi:hypothetical protein